MRVAEYSAGKQGSSRAMEMKMGTIVITQRRTPMLEEFESVDGSNESASVERRAKKIWT